VLDVLIRGGTVIDGSGAPPWPADVAIEGDRVRAVERLPSAEAGHVIDATGRVVAPGFIDMHSHADFVLPGLPTADSKVHQGFTLEVVGNCGASPAPLTPLDPATVADAATFTDPHRYPRGIPWVLVNGRPVVADGRHTGLRPGRVLGG
jgi:N-acyl-D-amino-acid deacylase